MQITINNYKWGINMKRYIVIGFLAVILMMPLAGSADIINEEKSAIILKLLQIRKLAIQLSKTKHKELQSILDTTLERLQLIAEQDMDSNI